MCCALASKNRSLGHSYSRRLLLSTSLPRQACRHQGYHSSWRLRVAGIELIQQFVNTDMRLLTQEHPDVLQGMFGFSIESIKSPEVLPKRASAKLWKDIFESTGNSHGQHQGTSQHIVDHFGFAVTHALVSNICGEVDASSLEHVVAPLRALIRSDKNARAYLTSSLAQQPLLQRFQEDAGVQEMLRKFIESCMRYSAQIIASIRR